MVSVDSLDDANAVVLTPYQVNHYTDLAPIPSSTSICDVAKGLLAAVVAARIFCSAYFPVVKICQVC